MSKPTIAQIENAFQPAKEIDDAKRFAGRNDAVRDAYLGLIATGSNLAIVGNRGIGKTSLARQVINIAQGSADILEKLKISHDDKLDFLAVYFACGKSVSTTDDLLTRLLTSSQCLADWIYDIPKAAKAVKAYAPKFGVNVFGAEASLGGEKRTEVTSEPAIASHTTEAVFTNVAKAIADAKLANHGVLIVVDEFDQISDPTGFASFLKSIATNVPSVKFCLVGVANDIQNLMKEHESSDRLFAGSIISLPPMDDTELSEIIRIAEHSIGKFITFDEPATAKIIKLAQGHPYMVHLVGKYALRAAFYAGKSTITADDVNDTLRSIAERGADPVLEGRYKKAVASSEHREIVLKALAESLAEDGEVWTTNAYKLALDHGVDNASQYVGQLVTGEYGGEIEKVRDRYYRFHDSLFAAYVRARPKLVSRVR